jgi:serine O-acetyltransferase
MSIQKKLKSEIPAITKALVGSYALHPNSCHLGYRPLPSREAMNEVTWGLLELLFPGFHKRQQLNEENISFFVGDLLDTLHDELARQIARSLLHERDKGLAGGCAGADGEGDCLKEGLEKSLAFLARLPGLRQTLEEDVQAAFAGDPAARNYQEVIFCYPGIEAVTIYRLAHEMFKLEVPLLPRMMTELAHSRTGIDIHPGATIGPGLFIDHGTGVVVGETCHIGCRVKLYQGVTLGAVSFPRDAAGNIIRGKKRHPTLEDDVVVYANATILGGETTIGRNAVIGSSVWLTQSVPPGTVVTMDKPSLRIRGPEPQTPEDNLFYQI